MDYLDSKFFSENDQKAIRVQLCTNKGINSQISVFCLPFADELLGLSVSECHKKVILIFLELVRERQQRGQQGLK